MRTITAETIQNTVADLCIQANRQLPPDVVELFRLRTQEEPWPLAKETLTLLQENMALAQENQLPICQDTGMVSLTLTLGQDVHIAGNLHQAIAAGVAQGYQAGYLRNSMVADPLRRENTGDNTPVATTIHLEEGEGCHLTLTPKGFGSENMSRLKMCRPADGLAGVEAFVLETVTLAGPNACPPMVVAVGIGGNFDKAPALAKQALARPLTSPHPDPFYQNLERDWLEKINALGIGPQGYGGRTTALAVAIEYAGTHVAGLPVAVCISCNVTRRATAHL